MSLKLILSGLCAGILAACVSVLPEPEAPDALYSIKAQSQFAGLSQTLIVREPEAARLVAGQGLVSEGSDGGLRMIPRVEWAGPATRQIQYAMIDSFKPGPAGNAVAPELGVLADYELASRLSGLQLRGPTAICTMVVSLIDASDRSLVARREIAAQVEAASSTAQDRALALSAAGADCARQASQFAIETLADRA